MLFRGLRRRFALRLGDLLGQLDGMRRFGFRLR